LVYLEIKFFIKVSKLLSVIGAAILNHPIDTIYSRCFFGASTLNLTTFHMMGFITALGVNDIPHRASFILIVTFIMFPRLPFLVSKVDFLKSYSSLNLFQRLVVCLEESLFIHNIRDMKVLHTIRETPPNKNGLCALSTDSDHCYLVRIASNFINSPLTKCSKHLRVCFWLPFPAWSNIYE